MGQLTLKNIKTQNHETHHLFLTIILGDIATDGSWRLFVSGTDLLIQRREAGVWTTKSTISA